jgi:hypothetical protein
VLGQVQREVQSGARRHNSDRKPATAELHQPVHHGSQRMACERIRASSPRRRNALELRVDEAGNDRRGLAALDREPDSQGLRGVRT